LLICISKSKHSRKPHNLRFPDAKKPQLVCGFFSSFFCGAVSMWINKRVWLLGLVISTLCAAQNGVAASGLQPKIDQERAAELDIKRLGQSKIAGVSVATFQVDTRTGLDLTEADRLPYDAPAIPKITPKAAAAISLIFVSGYGWLALPRDWQVIDGGVGADGSMVLIAQSKTQADEWLRYRDTGACVGCALSAASCYYPQAQKQAIDYEMGQCDKPKFKAQSANSPALQTTATQKGQSYAWRYYEAAPDTNFRELSLHSGSKIQLRAPTTVALATFFAQWRWAQQ
jgi:hypothetical protein